MLQVKDFVKCGSPYKPYELHVSNEDMLELIKRDVAMDKILNLRDDDSITLDHEGILEALIEITENLK